MMIEPKKFRKKPVVIEAMQLVGTPPGGTNVDVIASWIRAKGGRVNVLYDENDGIWMLIDTPEGSMQARFTDWIIRGWAGEFYPCKPDIFDATYEVE